MRSYPPRWLLLNYRKTIETVLALIVDEKRFRAMLAFIII